MFLLEDDSAWTESPVFVCHKKNILKCCLLMFYHWQYTVFIINIFICIQTPKLLIKPTLKFEKNYLTFTCRDLKCAGIIASSVDLIKLLLQKQFDLGLQCLLQYHL